MIIKFIVSAIAISWLFWTIFTAHRADYYKEDVERQYGDLKVAAEYTAGHKEKVDWAAAQTEGDLKHYTGHWTKKKGKFETL